MRLTRLRAYRDVVRLVDRPVLLACSGGVDSTALFALLRAAYDAGRVPRFAVAYVDHGTRPETQAECEHVGRMSAAAGFDFVPLAIDALEGPASEARLRAARYAVLAHAATRLGIDTLVTAHTRDDQVETVLMRLLSGAGGLATAGMREVTTLPGHDVRLVRPLLGTTRRELREIVDRLELVTLEDPTNADTRLRRNALRQRVIPRLAEVFPGFEQALLRSAELAAADAAFVDRLAEAEWPAVARESDHRLALDRARLLVLDPVLSSRIVRRAASAVARRADVRELTRERVAAVLAAARGRSGATIELPYGVVARIERDAVWIERRDGSDGDRR